MDDAATAGDPPTDPYLQHRRLLLGVAYRILGSYAEAEDVVQEVWLRWDADHHRVESPKAWLVTVTTRLAVDRLRRAMARRDSYVGPWLPEPVRTEPDVAEDLARADSVSLAMLVVLEALSPLERAVFVLHEAFDYQHPEVAQILGRTEPAVRQLLKRARDHVAASRPRYDTDRTTRRLVTERFLKACLDGDVHTLLEVLAPEVQLVSDTGGQGKAPLRVIDGMDKVLRFFVAIAQQPVPDQRIEVTDVNGVPGVIAYSGSEPRYVAVLDTRHGRVESIKLTANPDKLTGVADAARRPA
ncbi:MAG TPA: RNA polymerase sigma factor SigJ [Nocardioidaceae bacterium]|nr:RNA polymerase sigma factor SigJ [Nocardioidaceae bacterium]